MNAPALIGWAVIGAISVLSGLIYVAAMFGDDGPDDDGCDCADWSGEGQIHFHNGSDF